MPLPLPAPPGALDSGRARRRRGGTGQQREGEVEVRRKVVKVTVALTARARNNIGVLPCVCVCAPLSGCGAYVCRACARACTGARPTHVDVRAARARTTLTEDLFLVPRATAFLTKVLPVRRTSRTSVPMTDLDRRGSEVRTVVIPSGDRRRSS